MNRRSFLKAFTGAAVGAAVLYAAPPMPEVVAKALELIGINGIDYIKAQHVIVGYLPITNGVTYWMDDQEIYAFSANRGWRILKA